LKKYFFNIFFLGLIFSLLLSCSRKKDTWSSRSYHQTTAKYNGYFYAKESIKEGMAILNAEHEEDWYEILPVFVIGSERESKSIYPQMDRAIEKASNVIDRHSMVIKKKEDNKWIKYNYYVIGQAYFYKHDYNEARKMFDFIIKQYKDEPIKKDALLWLARTYMEDDEMGKSLSMLKLLQDESDISQELLSDFRATYADYYIRQEQYKKAISYIEDAILVTKDRLRKARLSFILAQLYQENGNSTLAIETYKKVVKLHPEYEMVFYASINQALAFSYRDSNSEEIKKLLNKMLKDHKNVEYYDQIYFALGEIELEEGNKDQAIEYFIESTRVSISNVYQKGRSFMMLGDLYMDERAYKEAKIYYDSTVIFMDKENEEYARIEALDEGLGDLIINLEILELNDSLLRLAGLTQKEREEIIIALISEEEAAIEAERIAAETTEKNDNYKSSVDKSVPLSSRGKSSSKKGDWYFYNPNHMSSGYAEFRQKWGDRELRDHWRRAVASTNTGVTSNDIDNFDSDSDGGGDIVSSGGLKSNVKSMDEYMKEIPFSEEEFSAAELKVEDALYNAGVIYNEKISDVDNAIEMFDELVQRFPESQYLTTAYYQLYRLYVKKEVEVNYFGAGYRDNSEYYKDIILTDYPYSEYAKIIRNPNYLKEAELTIKKKEEDYIATYRNYKSHRYNIVLDESNKVITEDPENPFIAKYYFMKAMVVGSLSDEANFERELQLLADNFPQTEEGERAVEILNQLNKKGLKTPGKGNKGKAKNTPDKPTTNFEVNESAEHFFAIIYPNSKGNVNKVKVAISNFDKKYYANDKLKVTNSFINKDNQIVIVRRFENAERAMSYYKNFISDEVQLKKVNDENFTIFLISSKNFTKLFKSKDIEGYNLFFQENYL
jgi:tetratricopeptide (TPR) repeat protein